MKDLDGHAMWCNSKALELAGIDKSYAHEFNKENIGELITVDSTGNPIGYLRESGCDKVKLLWPVYKTQYLEKCINVWLTYGVTAVNDMNPDQPGCDIHNQLQELNNNGKLLVRQFLAIVPDASEEEIKATQKRFNSDMLRLNALKIFMDGAGSSFTASMLKPYKNLCHAGSEPYCSVEQIKSYIINVRTCYKNIIRIKYFCQNVNEGGVFMHIVIITGSAHRNGTSALLAEQFINGAEDAGHQVFKFDAAFADVHPCVGCDHCECGKKDCVFKDDMMRLYPKLEEADLIAFATPLYYHGMSAQIKAVIDRFHGINNLLCGAKKKAVLLVSAADTRNWVMDGVMSTYETDLRYLQWEDCGSVLATGCYYLEDILKTAFPKQAYDLGSKLK